MSTITQPACKVSPLSAFLSTNLSSQIDCYGRLGDRIKRSLGWPIITVEIHQDQLNENIQLAVEFFTKYAGYTQEFLVFNSDLYERNRGIRLDKMFSIYNTMYKDADKVSDIPPTIGMNFDVALPEPVYIAIESVSSTLTTASSALSADFRDGLDTLEVIDENIYNRFVTEYPTLSANFKKSKQTVSDTDCSKTDAVKYDNSFDYDIMDYRKVVAVTEFEEGSSTGVNTLFTIEQTLAQQTYFSYAMGNYGFDLVSWYTMKEFIDLREKMLATRRDLKFDERTQYLTMYPQPHDTHFWGVISCYVERPIRDVIKEQWVYKYALALSKMTIGYVRGKIQGASMIGGGSLNYELLQEGTSERDALEELLTTGASTGYGDGDPILMMLG